MISNAKQAILDLIEIKPSVDDALIRTSYARAIASLDSIDQSTELKD